MPTIAATVPKPSYACNSCTQCCARMTANVKQWTVLCSTKRSQNSNYDYTYFHRFDSTCYPMPARIFNRQMSSRRNMAHDCNKPKAQGCTLRATAPRSCRFPSHVKYRFICHQLGKGNSRFSSPNCLLSLTALGEAPPSPPNPPF